MAKGKFLIMIDTICVKLNKEYYKAYKDFIERSEEAMFYHKLEYLNLISSLDCSRTIENHLVVLKNGDIIAFMPVFIFKGEFGNVINSSPFFGSHGGIIKLPNLSSSIDKMLLDEFERLYQKYNCISSTIIEFSPFHSEPTQVNYKYNYLDERISLFNILPNEISKEKISKKLFSSCHSHHKRILKKYVKINNQFNFVRNETSLEEIWTIHKNNMERIGGNFKSLSFFKSIEKFFKLGEDFEIYTLKKDKKIAATLLLFIFKDTVEYFTPAINYEFRNYQPLNFLIFESMIDLVYRRKMKLWNWGGTWEEQKGLYTYKKRWGALETKYRYFINCKIDILKGQNKDELLKNYPNYYLIPFNKL